MQAFGPAVRNGGTKLDTAGAVKKGTGMIGGSIWGVVQVKTAEDKCQNAAGTLNYQMPSLDGAGLRRMQIPWAGVFCPAEPVSAEIAFPDAAAAAVKPEKLIWAGELRDMAFSFSTPVAWK